MLISKQWLQDFVFLPDSLDSKELAEELTMKTVEVEGFEEQKRMLDNVVVGEIVSVRKHPDADKLKVCSVDIGDKKVKVVCGGSNVKKGMKVALGKIGARVRWHGDGDLVELQKTKIRGVESSGMTCASDEIGLGALFPKQDEKEIMDIGDIDAVSGTPLAEAIKLDDVVFDIDNKSMTHRPDLWGHYGMARELAAIYRKKLNPYKVRDIKTGKDVEIKVEIENKELCPRYMAVAIGNISVGSSPDWMQKRLMAVGLRPINNIVDITNYVMFELGQPMHAFDVGQLTINNQPSNSAGRQLTINIRQADKGEEFVSLDEKEHKLDKDMQVISNAGKAIALAGVIGGENSGVGKETSTIVFESANFDATNVRKTATVLGIRTDSSARFEKSLDPNNTELALKRAVELTLKICPKAKVVSNVADVFHALPDQEPIDVPVSFFEEKIGVLIKEKEIIDILERLGFGVKSKKDMLHVSVPSWRATKDISIAEDIVEEVARMYGYDNITPDLPKFSITPPRKNKLRELERNIKELLAHEHAYTEVYNYSFVSLEWLRELGIETKNHIELANPIAKDRPFLRRNLIPNLLGNIESNLHRFESVKLFEIGRTYRFESSGERMQANSDELLPKQDTILGMVYAAKGDDKPFYELLGSIKGAFERFGTHVSFYEIENSGVLPSHPGRYAEIKVGKISIGKIAELHPHTQEKIGIPHRTAMLEINLNTLLLLVEEKSSYESLSTYPSVDRDIAFVVGGSVPHAKIVDALKDIDPLVVGVTLFDVYEGTASATASTKSADRQGKIQEGKKSMAYHIIYRSNEKTLKAAEVDSIHKNMTNMLKTDFDAEIRV